MQLIVVCESTFQLRRVTSSNFFVLSDQKFKSKDDAFQMK